MPDSKKPVIVSKFGGSSAADAERLRNVVGIVDHTRKEGRTVVVITHDRGVADRAPRKITLKDGEILSDQRKAEAT